MADDKMMTTVTAATTMQAERTVSYIVFTGYICLSNYELLHIHVMMRDDAVSNLLYQLDTCNISIFSSDVICEVNFLIFLR